MNRETSEEGSESVASTEANTQSCPDRDAEGATPKLKQEEPAVYTTSEESNEGSDIVLWPELSPYYAYPEGFTPATPKSKLEELEEPTDQSKEGSSNIGKPDAGKEAICCKCDDTSDCSTKECLCTSSSALCSKGCSCSTSKCKKRAAKILRGNLKDREEEIWAYRTYRDAYTGQTRAVTDAQNPQKDHVIE